MEKKLLEIFISYTANNSKTLEIAIRSKENYSYIQQCKVELSKETIISLDNIIELFERYIGGAANE